MSLSQSGLAETLAPIPWITSIHFFETLESTSHRARQMAREGATAGTLVVADGQSGGHGRKGATVVLPARREPLLLGGPASH
jgi:hypothetical protein